MDGRRKNQIEEKILLLVTGGLLVALIVLTVFLTKAFTSSSDEISGGFDMSTITSDETEYVDVSDVFLPEFIGITAKGKRVGVSSEIVAEDIFGTLSPTVAYILSKSDGETVGEDEWDSLTGLDSSAYIRFHSQMPERVVRYFCAGCPEDYDVSGETAYIYEMFVIPFSRVDDSVRMYTRSLDGTVLRYTVTEPETYISSAELDTLTEAYVSGLTEFAFAGNSFDSLLYTEPVFTENVKMPNLIITKGTAQFIYDSVSGVKKVIGEFGMNPDKISESGDEDDSSVGYIDSRGAFYVRDSAFEYRAASDGVEISSFAGYSENGDYSIEDYIRAAVILYKNVRALDRNFAGADAGCVLTSVSAKNGRVTVELSYTVDNTMIKGMPPALYCVFENGFMKEASLYTVAVRERNDSTVLIPETAFAAHISKYGTAVYNASLCYRADYISESVKAEWTADYKTEEN